MNRTRLFLTVTALLATFAWLQLPEVRSSPAALWPSALAVGLAFVTRDIYLALVLGAFSGALLLHGGHPWTAFHDLLIGRLIPSLTDRWNISVLVFTLMMGGFVEVLHRNGGMTALSRRVLGRSTSPRRAGMGAFFMGWLLFFDGLASSMLVGKTWRTITDRAGLSREKLAFIVDSTASPIAGLALLSTWVAYEMSVIREGLVNTGDAALVEAVAPYSWLVLSLPFRFYNWFMLLLVFLVVWLGRDWGPMLAAEQSHRLNRAPHVAAATAHPAGSHAALALVPLAVLMLGVFGGLYLDGGGRERPFTFPNLIAALGQADAAAVFVLATALAALMALGLTAVFRYRGANLEWSGRTETQPATSSSSSSSSDVLVPGGGASCDPTPETLHKNERHGSLAAPALNGSGSQAFLHGMQQMFLPALILVCAWMLNSVIKELGAASYLVGLLGERLPAAWLPALVFLLAATVSFSTGTSWGTMAIVMPLVVPLAVQLTAFQAGMTASPVLLATVGAVLAGAVFGDHCSPISDTTLVSAFSSDCDVMAHVRTQLPYALAAALLAVLLGYGPAGYGIAPGWLLAIGGAACWALVRYVGRPRSR